MAVQLERHLFTLDEYERMIESGAFAEDTRIELIRGEIIDMAPQKLPHVVSVSNLTTLIVGLTMGKAVVWPQSSPLRIAGHSRPEPDLTLLKWRDDRYAAGWPLIEDVLLVVEVADTSLGYDRRVKGLLYAEAGIPEYWLVNLRSGVVEVYRDPAGGKYRHVTKARHGETLPLPGGLPGALAVREILVPPAAG